MKILKSYFKLMRLNKCKGNVNLQMPNANFCKLAHASKFPKGENWAQTLEHTEFGKGGAVSFTNFTDQERYL